MKNYLLIFLLAIAPMAAVTTFTGCKTSQQVVTYKTLASTQAAVESARKAFLDVYAKGLITPADAARASAASEKFNKAYNAAIFIVKSTQAPTPTDVTDAANAFLVFVSTFIK